MVHRGKVILSLRWLANELRQRQKNKFDVNIGVSGKRGDGKSTFLLKLFKRFKKEGFKQFKHQVYARDDVIRLLKHQTFGYCWDDEAINSGYKRDFQNAGQKELIKIVTMYRDHFNIYGSAMPFFLSMDKDLRELLFMHVHIIERGIGAVFMPLSTSIFTSDPWDIKNNAKIEIKENERLKRKGDTNFPYHKFSTFVGYVYFGGMTEREEEKYLKIKHKKRHEATKEFKVEQELTFAESCYKLLVEGNLTKEGLIQACTINNKNYKSITEVMNRKLKENGIVDKSVKDMFCVVNPNNNIDRRRNKVGKVSASIVNDLLDGV